MSKETTTTSYWEDLYIRLRPRLVRALIASTGRAEGVEDAIQEAFVRAMAKESDDISTIDGWLFVVARNHCRRSLRRRVGAAIGDLFGPDQLEQATDRIDIVKALHRLSERDRNLVIAKYYLGMRQAELAAVFHIPQGTVSAALSRALRRLRRDGAP
jgi:RNA polymerase sigma factor (sigma-70 family)